ncbi:MAG: tetratricopeptide repeat protein [Promethearchaeota archaeon]|jgi:tetratricopeptide (TPR) repeat protein
MINSVLEEIERGYQLLNKGKEVEALNLINNFEKKENLAPKEKLECQNFRGVVFIILGKFDEALEISEHSLQESIKLQLHLLTIDATLIKWEALFFLERIPEAWKDVEYCEKLLKSPLEGSDSEIEHVKSNFMYMRGYYHFWAGEYDQALQYHKKVLEITKKQNRFRFMIAQIQMILGGAYVYKGELDKALEHHKKSLESGIESNAFNHRLVKAVSFTNIGIIYRQKSDLSKALENFKKSLQIFEQLNSPIYVGTAYDNLISISLENKDIRQAQDYLKRFARYNKKIESVQNSFSYELSRARILKSSTRTRDWTEAENIIKELIKNPFNKKEFIPGLITLCDFYFQELKLTNDLTILEDIQPLVERINSEAERTNSFSLLAYVFLLNGKLSLLRLNMGDTRRYLTKAQQIADSHGLQLLAREISYEHDKLLEQLDRLEGYKKNEITPSERMNLASLDDMMDLMQGRREINTPKLNNEEPVLLLILTTGGVLIFSYSFADEWSFDSELFGGFLTAINSISDEVFSEGLDRVKFGQHTVLMEPLANFSVCYLYKGQTYLAKQKLAEFTGLVQGSSSIEQIFEKFEKTSQVIEIEDFPFLKPLITKIFEKSN